MKSDVTIPVNIGGAEESSVLEIGQSIWKLIRGDEPTHRFFEAR